MARNASVLSSPVRLINLRHIINILLNRFSGSELQVTKRAGNKSTWKKRGPELTVGTWGLFLESPETFRAHFGLHNALCILKMKASRGTKLCIYFNFHSLYNI